MAHPVIDTDECVACGVCVDTCPCDVLELGDDSSGRISVTYAPHAVYTVAEPILRAVAEDSARTGRVIHIHASETAREVEECVGAHGVIIPKRRSVGLTAAVGKASAGAVEYMKVARVSNLAGAIDRLKDEGLWIAGADMEGTEMTKADLKGAIGLVIGSEGDGLSRLIREKCDFLVSIPMSGHIDSLNAAVAAAILMFEKKRQG